MSVENHIPGLSERHDYNVTILFEKLSLFVIHFPKVRILTDCNNNFSDPVISVIVAVKNGAKTLQRAIDSFTTQTYPHKELIIIDGDSSDNTTDIILSNNDIISYSESRPDRGIPHAWNKGLRHINGQWIIFLGSDDFFHDSEVFTDFIRKSTAVSGNQRIVYGQVNLITENMETIATSGQEWHKIHTIFFSEKMMIPHQACFHHYSVFQDFGFFDENFTIVADYEFLLRVLKDEKPLFLPDFMVTNMFFGGLSSQVSTLLTMQLECDKALIKNGFKPTGYKRFGNVFVYRLLGLLLRFTGEKPAAVILDKFRILLGRHPIWARKQIKNKLDNTKNA